MDPILIETATNSSPVSVAAAPPEIAANVSQAPEGGQLSVVDATGIGVGQHGGDIVGGHARRAG